MLTYCYMSLLDTIHNHRYYNSTVVQMSTTYKIEKNNTTSFLCFFHFNFYFIFIFLFFSLLSTQKITNKTTKKIKKKKPKKRRKTHSQTTSSEQLFCNWLVSPLQLTLLPRGVVEHTDESRLPLLARLKQGEVDTRMSSPVPPSLFSKRVRLM
jgi:hypothetical protein